MAKAKTDHAEPRADPKADERRRLRSLAFSRGLLSRVPSHPPRLPLRPSAAVLKHDGKDIVKKGHRKNRFLFSLPGLIAPRASAQIGELSDLASGNPVLYLNFPNGRMKLFGTIVYPKNRYLTLQFAKKNVLCEDSFDSLVIFSDAWWIGTKEENPGELKLNFPTDQIKEKDESVDFKGGAGGTSEERIVSGNPSKEHMQPTPSPDAELKDYMSDDSNLELDNQKLNKMETTPVRQSARTSGKTLNYAEQSEDESSSSDMDKPDSPQMQIDGHSSGAVSFDSSEKNQPSGKEPGYPKNLAAEKGKLPLSSIKNAEETSSKGKCVLVQTTLSGLFQKVTGKEPKDAPEMHTEQKGSGVKQQESRKSVPSRRKPGTPSKKGPGRKKLGVKKQHRQVEADDVDVESISSDSQEIDDSDEEWTV